jgi:hypothetical protein
MIYLKVILIFEIDFFGHGISVSRVMFGLNTLILMLHRNGSTLPAPIIIPCSAADGKIGVGKGGSPVLRAGGEIVSGAETAVRARRGRLRGQQRQFGESPPTAARRRLRPKPIFCGERWNYPCHPTFPVGPSGLSCALLDQPGRKRMFDVAEKFARLRLLRNMSMVALVVPATLIAGCAVQQPAPPPPQPVVSEAPPPPQAPPPPAPAPVFGERG